MKKEELFIIDVLKAFIREKSPDFNKEYDWNQVFYLANIHAVTGILGYLVMLYPNEKTEQYSALLRHECLQNYTIFTQRAEMMKSLKEQMNEEKIEHLLFKGFVLRDYYPVPELRTFGDIDFLIRSQDRQKSHELMLNAGFQLKTDWEPIYSYVRDMEYYEIHTEVMEVDVSDKADYKGYFRNIWNHAIQVDQHTWELEPEYHFLYLLTHIAKHISGSGAGIRMYMDIAVFIQHFGDRIDWKYICGELEKLKFTDFANTVLTVVEKYFEVKSPIPLKEIPEQVIEDFMEYTLEGGVFGYAKRDGGVIALKRENHNNQDISRAATLIHRLFPSASSLESRYTYLQGKHWLLPLAWVHRIFRTKGKWKSHTKEAKSILTTETEEVLRLKRIYTEIGL